MALHRTEWWEVRKLRNWINNGEKVSYQKLLLNTKYHLYICLRVHGNHGLISFNGVNIDISISRCMYTQGKCNPHEMS